MHSILPNSSIVRLDPDVAPSPFGGGEGMPLILLGVGHLILAVVPVGTLGGRMGNKGVKGSRCGGKRKEGEGRREEGKDHFPIVSGASSACPSNPHPSIQSSSVLLPFPCNPLPHRVDGRNLESSR